MFHREKLYKQALKDFSFTVSEGEILGLIGANGAGKTTLIKLLSGILYPTEGGAEVLGFTPWERKNAFKHQIGVVMAQKTQLWWDLPAIDSFEVNRYIYELSDAEYRRNLDELITLFHVEKLQKVQVRRLSLGERMKFEIIASLLHNPKVIFLDEPTIGLDVVAQRDMRRFILEYRKNHHATILVTSHYMQDIDELCNRAVVLNHGTIVYDGSIAAMKELPYRTLVVHHDEHLLPSAIKERWAITSLNNGSFQMRLQEEEIKPCISALIDAGIINFNFVEANIEERVIDLLEQRGGVSS